LSSRNTARPLERFGRHPLGAFLLGMAGTAPLGVLGPLFDSRAVSQAARVGAWQIAGFVAAFVGGLAGLAVWDAGVGRTAPRHAERLRRRMTERPVRSVPSRGAAADIRASDGAR
jgi:hypothetical protein